MMDKSDRRRFQRPAASVNSIIAKYRHDDDDNTEQWKKYRQGRNRSVYHDRSERRQSNSPIDTTMGYHYSTDMSRLRKHHVSSSNASRTKYQISSVPEEAYKTGDKNHGILRALRCYPNNFAVVSKSRYKDDEEGAEDDNPEEETGEEIVDDEQDNVSEDTDKDYEEQEADDEVDEESDVLEPQVERLKTQRKNRTDPPMRTLKKNSKIEPSHCHHEQKIGIEKNPQRCCYVADERDNVDDPTEDDEDHHELGEEITCPTKKTTWKFHDHQDKERRIVPKNVMERYSNLNKTNSGLAHQNRRPRTTKPDVESSMTLTRVHHGPIRNNKCSYCGVSTGQKPKMTLSRNADIGLQHNRYFTGIPIGDEDDYFKDPEPAISYQTKPRRSRESKLPDYDPHEGSRNLDAELGAIYKACRTKIPRDFTNSHCERTKHSTRVNNNRHEPFDPSKNDNRYRK